jgi:hypothetical protein
VARLGTDDRKPKDRCNQRQGGRNNKPGANKRSRTADDDDDKEVKDHYYFPKEYAKLTPSQRSKLQKLRDGHNGNKQVSAALMDLQKLTIAMAELQKSTGDKDKDKDEDTPMDDTESNRSNPALQRKPPKNK